jgi:hypothetical protein
MRDRHSDAVFARKSLRFSGTAAGWNKLGQIEDRIFTEPNLQFCGFGVAWAWAIFAGWSLLGGWIIGHGGMPRSIDFCWIWVSGKLAALSNSAEIYNPAAFTAAQDTLLGTGECSFLHFSYPPTVLFFTYPLGFLPYTVAFALWIIVTIVLYLAAVYAIIPRPAAVIAAFTPMAVPLNVLSRHNGFLTAGLLGLSLGFMEREPWLAGICLGLATYKPQFGVLFPLALLASRNWRALCSASATSAALGVAAVVAFGYQGWPSFINLLWHRNESLSADGGVELNLQSIYGLLHWAGASAWIAWAVHLTIAAIVAVMVCALWAKLVPYSLKAAIICTGAVTVSPYLLAYDLCILSIAVAFLVRDGMSRGFLPGERTGLLICFVGLFAIAKPIAPIICAVLFFLIARRIVACNCDLLAASRDESIGYALSQSGSLQ